MTLNNPLANVLSSIHNSEKISRHEVEVKNNSKVIRKVLDILREQEYVANYEVIEDGRGGKIQVRLAGTINKIGVITPNFSVKYGEYQKWEKQYLPAKDFGIIVVSTSKGMMTHNQAQELGIGGRLIAYCY